MSFIWVNEGAVRVRLLKATFNEFVVKRDGERRWLVTHMLAPGGSAFAVFEGDNAGQALVALRTALVVLRLTQ